MNKSSFCGIDFGTSNSTVGICKNGKVSLAPVEKSHTTIPSAVFFDYEELITLYGREAVATYIEGVEGRLMRSLKSVLGSALMEEKTIINRKRTSFVDIIGMVLQHLKSRAEQEVGTDIDSVVLGRPVHFDDNEDADKRAQDALEDAARSQGFRNIVFQYEPIAAALDFEQSVDKEKLAFIVDIGGGTSDFSIVRVSPENHLKTDRKGDVLANTGVHIGGTDFDKELNLHKVMPHVGYKSEMWNFTKTEKLLVPNDYFVSLATWHLINTLYKQERIDDVKKMSRFSLAPELINRLYDVLDNRQGHRVLNDVEKAKIALSHEHETIIDLSYVENALSSVVLQQEFEETIGSLTGKIVGTVENTLKQAGLTGDDIDVVFLTGGSTSIPYIQNSILNVFPNAERVTGDLFGSVGTGLAIEARNIYG